MNGRTEWSKTLKRTGELSRKHRNYTKVHHQQMQMLRKYQERVKSGENPKVLKEEMRIKANSMRF